MAAYPNPWDPKYSLLWDERASDAMQVYTNSIGNHIAESLKTRPGLSVKSVGLSDPDMGLADETLTNCDVLIWWSHTKNKLVPDDKVAEIVGRIKSGDLSLIALHSALTSKVFIEAMNERTREDAFNQMIAHAGELGANAVIGVRYDATEIGNGITEVLCYGTAVFVERLA